MQKPIKPSRPSKTKYATYEGETLQELFSKYGEKATLSVCYEDIVEIEYLLSDEDVEQEYQEALERYELSLKEYNIWLIHNRELLDKKDMLEKQLFEIRRQLA